MLRFYASAWNQIIRDVERLSDALATEPFIALIEGRRREVVEPLQRIETLCRSLELNLSAAYAAHIIALIEGSPSLHEHIVDAVDIRRTKDGKSVVVRGTPEPLNPAVVRSEVSILRRRIDDELAGREFFALESGRVKYLAPNLFSDEVSDAFPAAIIDIEEAGKCLAFDRATACVYHLMRVMENGLKATSKALGIPYAPSWESHLAQIDAKVKAKHKTKGVRWKRDEAFFRDVWAHLHAIKSAWRNPTMHIVRDYTPEQAEEIFRAVRTFMRHLATRLKATP